MNRRRFLNGCALTGLLLASGLPSCSEQKPWLEADFQELSEALQSAKVTALDLAKEFQQRNSKLNPLLNCTIEVNPNLEAEAGKIKLTETILGHKTFWLRSYRRDKFCYISAERQRDNLFGGLYVMSRCFLRV